MKEKKKKIGYKSWERLAIGEVRGRENWGRGKKRRGEKEEKKYLLNPSGAWVMLGCILYTCLMLPNWTCAMAK